MYSTNPNFVTYFIDEKAKHTDKVFYGRISEAIKIGVQEDGKKKFEFENWNARFVGKAREKAMKLADKTSIVLTVWNARCTYVKPKDGEGVGRKFPHIVVIDFEIRDAEKLDDKLSSDDITSVEVNND